MPFKQIIPFQVGLLLFSLFILSACKEVPDDDTPFNAKVMILGHRGMGVLYTQPGNTMNAIEPALAIGTDGCELDIQLTKDTVLVLYHDLDLAQRTNCSGRVYDHNWDELCACEYNAFQGEIYVNSVDDVFGKIPNLQQFYFSFDLGKIDYSVNPYEPYRDQYLRSIHNICEKYHMSDNVLLEGDEGLLVRARELGLTNKLFLFSRLDSPAINVCVSRGFSGISTDMNWFDVSAEEAHKRGLYIMAWSPNNESQNKMVLNFGADIIQTDDPISILKMLNRYNYEYEIEP